MKTMTIEDLEYYDSMKTMTIDEDEVYIIKNALEFHRGNIGCICYDCEKEADEAKKVLDKIFEWGEENA